LRRDPSPEGGVAAAEIVGVDVETIDNWIRRGVIARAPIGGRQLRNRLFSVEEVYRTALINELVTLGIPPSSASEAVDALWRQWGGKEAPGGRKLYALVVPNGDKWIASLCWRKVSGGPFYKLDKSMGRKSIEEMELPKQAFAMIPISGIFDRVTNKLSELLGEMKNQRG
jgi:MerR HTH family regulatory protein